MVDGFLSVNNKPWTVLSCYIRQTSLLAVHRSLLTVHCFAFLPFLGKILARNPSRKMPTRIAMSVISTVVSVVIKYPVLSAGFEDWTSP